MLYITVMCPLNFFARFPLREPGRFPSGRKPIKPESKTSDSGKQLTYRFFHFKPSYDSKGQLAFIIDLKLLAPTDVGSLVYILIVSQNDIKSNDSY